MIAEYFEVTSVQYSVGLSSSQVTTFMYIQINGHGLLGIIWLIFSDTTLSYPLPRAIYTSEMSLTDWRLDYPLDCFVNYVEGGIKVSGLDCSLKLTRECYQLILVGFIFTPLTKNYKNVGKLLLHASYALNIRQDFNLLPNYHSGHSWFTVLRVVCQIWNGSQMKLHTFFAYVCSHTHLLHLLSLYFSEGSLYNETGTIFSTVQLTHSLTSSDPVTVFSVDMLHMILKVCFCLSLAVMKLLFE